MGVWLSDEERRVLGALCDWLVPGGASGVGGPDAGGPDAGGPGAGGPGAVEAGAVDYIDNLLGAFSFDPPRIWAGGPTSGRAGGPAHFGAFLPLAPLDELAWRIRIEGTEGHPEREFNGSVMGLQQRYREGLAALGPAFVDLDDEERGAVLKHHRELVDLAYGHVCEALYGPPEYGGNRDLVGWRAIGWAGDTQPRGWTDEEVSEP